MDVLQAALRALAICKAPGPEMKTAQSFQAFPKWLWKVHKLHKWKQQPEELLLFASKIWPNHQIKRADHEVFQASELMSGWGTSNLNH